MARTGFFSLLQRVLPKALAWRWGMRLYPPYLGAGVRITQVAPDGRSLEVAMPLRWYNLNAVGTHFGGSLYSMTDPFYMLLLMDGLGPDFVVWDRAATIRFRRPGRGTVRARFTIDDALLDRLRAALPNPGDKRDEVFHVEVRDDAGDVVAEVEKVVYIRRKR